MKIARSTNKKIKKEAAPARKGFLACTRSRWAGMQLYSREEICRLDWIIAAVLLIFLYVTCIQGDLLLTGNRSFLFYQHPTDFYQASYEISGGYYANYLPSTFIAYAIWNLPLYLTGHIPEAMRTNSIINNMWYKLLPVILYLLTAWLIYKIAVYMGFGEKKARITGFAFIVFPVAVYSQFIFAQYDIFTVFFIVLGLYFYLQGKHYRFALMFGLAVTFKYQAVMYFLALLLLCEKRVLHLIKYAVVMAIPFAIEVIPNLGNTAFFKSVFGFSTLGNVTKNFQFGFFNGVNPVVVAGGFFLIWALTRRTENKQDLFSWAMFLCTGMSFALFGMASWNPQWLLIMVPFLVLGFMVNENGNALMLTTDAFMLAVYIYCGQSMVTETVVNSGVLKYVLPSDCFAVTLSDVYVFHNEEILCGMIWVILLAYVVFGHPRYHKRQGNTLGAGMMWQIRGAFLFGFAAFVLPLMVCIGAMLAGKTVFADNLLVALEPGNVAMIDEENTVTQNFTANGSTLEKIRIRIENGEVAKEDTIHVAVQDGESGETIYTADVATEGFTHNTTAYAFLNDEVPVEDGKEYVLSLSSDAEAGTGIGVYRIGEDLQMKITGSR